MRDDTIDRLKSDDVTTVLGELYRLGGEKVHRHYPDAEVESVLSLVSHEDQEVRERAIFVGGIHWRDKRFVVPIITILRNHRREDELVLITAIMAMGSIAMIRRDEKKLITEELSRVTLAKDVEREAAGCAYKQLLRIHEKISISEFASTRPDEVEINLEWVRSLIQ
jgi:hypothetical protein